MAVSEKSHFKLEGYLNFRLGRRVNLIINFEVLRKGISNIPKISLEFIWQKIQSNLTL